MSETTTWTYQRIFDPKTIKKSTTITFRERLRLLFKPSLFAFEDGMEVRYKKMNGIAYILSVRHTNASHINKD